MKKQILSCAVLAGLLFTTGCHTSESSHIPGESTDTSYAIIGKVTGLETGTIYIFHRQTGNTDSTALDHGYFKFNGQADTAEYCRISLYDQTKSFFLMNGKISMLIKKDSLPYAQITGTRVQDEYNYFRNEFSKTVNDQIEAVDKAYDYANHKKNQKAMDSLDKLFTALDLEQKQLVMDFTKTHPASVVSAFEIYSNFSYNPRAGQLDSLYQQLDTSVRITYFGQLIRNVIQKTQLTSVGNPAPGFSGNDPSGKQVSLASFKGKIVLLDFWASWCGPCRLENPGVVKAYHKFHDKGFDIFGVSLDDTKTDWMNAIKKDGLNWTQVSDLKGWKSDIASLYGIRGIPMNYLLDKNGIIIARALRGQELDNKLQELLH